MAGYREERRVDVAADAPGMHRSVVDQAAVVPVAPVGRVVATPVQGAVMERRVATSRRVDPAQIVAVVAGIALIVVGLVAAVRAGFDGPWSDPVVEVVGVPHTALQGLVEAAMGLVIVLCGLSRDRGPLLFFSIVFGVAALVAAIEPTVGGDQLAMTRGWAVTLVIGFAVIALVAALAPAVRRRSEYVEQI